MHRFVLALLLLVSPRAEILFEENFDGGNLNKWDERVGSAQLSSDRPFAGRGCLEITKTLGKDTGGDLKKWFLPGYPQIYLRFYVRFAEDYTYAHHFVHLMGGPARDRWKPFGKAGVKPDGSYFTTGIEPWFAWGKNPPPGELNFYSYFLDMDVDRKMNKYWGNSFFPPGPARGNAGSTNRYIPKRGQWECWEIMLKVNTTGAADGEQALWVDGKKLAHFTGIQWRSNEDALINCLWLLHYGFDSGDPTRTFWKQQGGAPMRDTVWFDEVVVATTQIGAKSMDDAPPVAPAPDKR